MLKGLAIFTVSPTVAEHPGGDCTCRVSGKRRRAVKLNMGSVALEVSPGLPVPKFQCIVNTSLSVSLAMLYILGTKEMIAGLHKTVSGRICTCNESIMILSSEPKL